MKAFLFICLLLCFNCNGVTDAVSCLLNIQGYKEAVQDIIEAIESKNSKEIIMATAKVLSNFKDHIIDCINKVHSVEGLICKHPIKNAKCLVECGLPDDSPRYCKCFDACRDEFCL